MWMILLACGRASPDVTVETPEVASVAAPTDDVPFPGFEGMLARVEFQVQSDDGGYEKNGETFFDGRPCPEVELLERWVSRHGWGGSVDERAKQFVAARLQVLWKLEFLDAPKFGIQQTIEERSVWASGRALPDFRPLTAERMTIDGRELVVVSGYTLDFVGINGRHYSFRAHAFDVKTGEEVTRGVGLPTTQEFAEGR